MDLSEKVLRLKPAGMSAGEWSVRLELAALYRAFDGLLRRAGIRCEHII